MKSPVDRNKYFDFINLHVPYFCKWTWLVFCVKIKKITNMPTLGQIKFIWACEQEFEEKIQNFVFFYMQN